MMMLHTTALIGLLCLLCCWVDVHSYIDAVESNCIVQHTQSKARDLELWVLHLRQHKSCRQNDDIDKQSEMAREQKGISALQSWEFTLKCNV